MSAYLCPYSPKYIIYIHLHTFITLSDTSLTLSCSHRHTHLRRTSPVCRPRAALAPPRGHSAGALTLCSGHRMEKLSSFSAQPGQQTEQKQAVKERPGRVWGGACLGHGDGTWLKGTSVVVTAGTGLLETAHYGARPLARRTHLNTIRVLSLGNLLFTFPLWVVKKTWKHRDNYSF